MQDTGLLDALMPAFERETGHRAKPIAVGSGLALQLAARGEGDVVLSHSPEAEERWLAEGHGTGRRLVMHNFFLVVGPPSDPAGIRGAPSMVEAFRAIAVARARFVSRGDESGTHARELAIWRKAGLQPAGGWYQSTGSGQGQTLRVASEKQGYALTDRGTYLALRKTLDLEVLAPPPHDPDLLNVYHVLPVNPARGVRVNAAGGKAFADWLVGPAAQRIIGDFGREQYGEALFIPDAGKTVETLLSASGGPGLVPVTGN